MKKMAIFGVLMGTALFFAPADELQAKEVPADGSIPLTSAYFPDEWFLKTMQGRYYDKNSDGFLSPEEVAAVTELSPGMDITDFSQLQYFTNLRELSVTSSDETDAYDLWMGDELDLTVFPHLEVVSLYLDSDKAPEGVSDIEIKVSGLEQLRYFSVYDRAAAKKQGAVRAGIGTIDFRNTKALEHVHVFGVEGVVFDDENQVKCICLEHVEKIPFGQIGGFEKLEDLTLTCPELKSVNVRKNRALVSLTLDADLLKTLDVSENTKLKYLTVGSKRLTSLNVRKNKKLVYLSVDCRRLCSLNLLNNTRLEDLRVKNTAVASLNLSRQKKLTRLEAIGNQKLKSLDLSKASRLSELICDKGIKVKGYKGKITRV